MDANAAVERAVELIKEQIAGHPKAWTRNVDLPQTIQYLRDTLYGNTPSRLHVVGNALVMYGIGGNWWTDRPVLHEELLLALDDQPADMHRMLAFLETTARLNGCVGVALGTSFSRRDPALIRLYNSHGYANEATMLYKEIT